MKENINALDEINKGATMGIEALSIVMDKVEDEKLKQVLKEENKKYKDIMKKINKIYTKYNEGDTPQEINVMNKAMTWWGIEMKTFNDTSNSKLAELLLQGENMGIIEGRKILNNKELDREVIDIIEEFVSMQEESVEILKAYL